MKVVLSAVQPSNGLTLGNYLGALKNWAGMSKEYDCYFFAVDMHAITVRQDPAELQKQTYEAVATYIACGIDPHSKLFVQSHVPEHAELGWLLTCFSYMGELGRMTQFKEKSRKSEGKEESIGAGLLMYPVLMAADILLYQTDLVPVGDDQVQHLQLARDLAERFNNFAKKPIFTVPTAIVPRVGARIMSLQNPTAKMSKSDSDPHATIYLLDSDDTISKKFKRAVTDSGSEIKYTDSQPGVKNLLDIQSAVTGRTVESLLDYYQGKQYGHLKVDTADIVIAEIGPIRDKTRELLAERRDFLETTLAVGAELASEKARTTLTQAYEAVGFLPRGFKK